VDRPDGQGPLDAVDGIELVPHLAQLLQPNRRGQLDQLGAQVGPLLLGGVADAGLEVHHPGVRTHAGGDLAAETTAAAAEPPITEANEPSTASTSIESERVAENTTKAPPW